MSDRVYNFSAGPSMMPLAVLEEAQRDLLNYGGTGTSVMEMSHRSPAFEEIINGTRDTLRRIMNIPENYEILFMQGGATTQFSAVAMNLADQGDTLAYSVTGQFAGKAQEEGARWGNAVIVASSKADKFSYIPKVTADMIPQDAKYLHICGNNTIFGSCYNTLPETGNIPLVADWSSAILGKQIDIPKYALVYAGAQKNMGPAGMAVVIIRKDLLERELDKTVPIMLRYKVAAENGSMYNTPPTFSIYIAGLMYKWVEKNGGVEAMEALNREKSGMLYDFLEESKLFHSPVAKEDRSIMNVTFTLPTQERTDEFLKLTKEKGMINLKGHRSVGGCRASMYNGMPVEGAKLLVETMKEFEARK